MDINFLDAETRDVATTSRSLPPGWTQGEATRLRLLVQCLLAAVTVSDVLTLRCLRITSLAPHRAGRYQTSLSPARALNLSFKADNSPVTAMLDTIAPERLDPDQ